MDEYQAGYTAGQKLFDDYHPEQNDPRKCVDKAHDATGYQVDVSDEARVYWSACLDALDGHDYTPSAQALEAMLSQEED